MVALIKKIIVFIFSNPILKKIISLDIYSFIDTLTVKTSNNRILFFGFGKMPVWRAKTFFTKEPETIEWINSFSENDVFWDIGANVGIYSLYAASLKKNIKVSSFEPSAANYFVLNRNIFMNHFDSQISAYPIAFSNNSILGHFQMRSDEPGGAINVFSDARLEETASGKETVKINVRQAMLSFSIDSFIQAYDPEFPNHIKIDVDNIEDKIVEGGMRTISDLRVKSLLVEMDERDTEYCQRVIALVHRAGLIHMEKKHSPMFDKGKFSSIYNFIFTR